MRGLSLVVLGFAVLAAACSSDPSGDDLNDGGNLPGLDAGGGDTGPVKPDGGGDTGPPDTVAPMAIVDLAATATSHTAIGLTWTAPSDPPSGKASSYDLRRSKTAIASDADFTAATAITPPAPNSAGAAEAFSATGLDPETTYYFAIKAKDAAGNVGPMSNVASATTKARGAVLLSEVAMLNPAGIVGTPGYDFIELVVTKAGAMQGIEVKQSGSPSSIHTFADFDVALGDRIVVHLTGLPGPTGFAQEDATKSKTSSTETIAFGSVDAYDVYSAGTGLSATDNLVSVVDGATVLDAVAYSARDGDVAAANMTAFATAKTNGAWLFTAVPVDATNDCATQREAVAISTSIGDGTCGRFASGMGALKSINRIGTTDTNTKKDWYVGGVLTPGAVNAAFPLPAVLGASATSATTVEIRFSQEIDASTVAANLFTGSGITINAATLTDVTLVTLTTSAQGGPHTVGIGPGLKTIYGFAIDETTFSFCGYEPLGGLIQLNEVNPLIPGTAGELIELVTTRSGIVGGFTVRLNPRPAAVGGDNLATLPAGLCVALGDFVVVHVDPPATIVGQSEATAKNEQPVATFSTHYDAAWDIRGTSTALPNTDGVIAVRDAANAYVDALAYTDASGAGTANFLLSLPYVQGLAQWLPADCGGATCGDASTPTAEGVAVSTVGVVNSVAGASLKRSATPKSAASWSVGASSWGN